MELAQIFILALCVVSVTMKRCHEENKLDRLAQKMLKKYAVARIVTPSLNPSSGCPVELFQKPASGEMNDRALSPWTYETVEDPEYYPSAYSRAVCLCHGCILVNSSGNVIDDNSYNSVLLNGSRVFMKREKCAEGGYRLVPESRDVPVGCTCVRPDVQR